MFSFSLAPFKNMIALANWLPLLRCVGANFLPKISQKQVKAKQSNPSAFVSPMQKYDYIGGTYIFHFFSDCRSGGGGGHHSCEILTDILFLKNENQTIHYTHYSFCRIERKNECYLLMAPNITENKNSKCLIFLRPGATKKKTARASGRRLRNFS